MNYIEMTKLEAGDVYTYSYLLKSKGRESFYVIEKYDNKVIVNSSLDTGKHKKRITKKIEGYAVLLKQSK